MANPRVRLFVTAMAVLFSSCLAHADCMDVVINLSPCLDYIMNNNSTSQLPPSECCLHLMTVVRSQPLCLCTIIDGEVEAKLGIPIDRNRALVLPAKCEVRTPTVSECKASPVMPQSPSPPSPDGFGMAKSPIESPNEMSASSTHSVHVDDYCPDCKGGSIDAGSLPPLLPP